MPLSPLRFIQILLVVAMFAVGVYLYPQLPEQIPAHWGFDGAVDGTMSKEFGLFLAPGIALLITILLPLLEQLDPKRKNYDAFRPSWELIQLSLTGFFGLIFFLVLYATLVPANANMVSTGILAGVGILFAILGFCFKSVRPTYFVGIRTPWTLASDTVWKKTHQLASTIWVIGGMLIAADALMMWHTMIIFAITLIMMVIIPIVYSAKIFKKSP